MIFSCDFDPEIFGCHPNAKLGVNGISSMQAGLSKVRPRFSEPVKTTPSISCYVTVCSNGNDYLVISTISILNNLLDQRCCMKNT